MWLLISNSLRKSLNLLKRLNWRCWLNYSSRLLLNSGSNSNSAFNPLTLPHFLSKSMFNSFFLGLILYFFFYSLWRFVISFCLISNFRMVFNLMINNLVFSDVFINWNSDFFFKLIILSHNLFIRHILKFALAFLNLTIFWPDLSSLKKYCLFLRCNIWLCSCDYSLNNNRLPLNRRRASSNSCDFACSLMNYWGCWSLDYCWCCLLMNNWGCWSLDYGLWLGCCVLLCLVGLSWSYYCLWSCVFDRWSGDCWLRYGNLALHYCRLNSLDILVENKSKKYVNPGFAIDGIILK